MATSVVKIVNNALVRIGASSIISLEENSEAARAANLIYEQIRDATLRDHLWNFAIKRVELALTTDTVAFGFTNAFQLPSDCLRVLNMEEADMKFVVEGDKLLTDEGTAKIRYVSQVTDPNKFDTMYVEALSARLAAELAITLVESNTIHQNMIELYRAKIMDARSIDAQESGEPEVVADTWLNSRINYAGSGLTVTVNGVN